MLFFGRTFLGFADIEKSDQDPAMRIARTASTALSLLILNICGAETPDGASSVRITDPSLRETSGLAVSQRDGNFLWAINDSGAAAQIHLMEKTGKARGVVRLEGIGNRDWEDLASFRQNDKAYLLVADVGDNAAKRETVFLHLVEEPELPEAGANLDLTLKPVWSLEFRYVDGPRDCECLAVDMRGRRILLLTKRDVPAALYELPLRGPKADEVMTAKRLGPTAKLPLPGNGLPHPFSFQPTAMDIAPDGSMAALLTYRGVFIVKRKPGQAWIDAFQQRSATLGGHALPQAEALAFDRTVKSVYFTSEGKNPELLRWPVR